MKRCFMTNHWNDLLHHFRGWPLPSCFYPVPRLPLQCWFYFLFVALKPSNTESHAAHHKLLEFHQLAGLNGSYEESNCHPQILKPHVTRRKHCSQWKWSIWKCHLVVLEMLSSFWTNIPNSCCWTDPSVPNKFFVPIFLCAKEKVETQTF